MFRGYFSLSADAIHDLILHYNLLKNYRFHMKLRHPKNDRSKSVTHIKWLRRNIMNVTFHNVGIR